jgi:hypothetical protein
MAYPDNPKVASSYSFQIYAHSLFREGSHTTKNTASGCRVQASIALDLFLKKRRYDIQQTTHSIMDLIMTLSLKDTQHYYTWHKH